MKKKILLIPLALLLIASLVACAAPAPAPAPSPVPELPEAQTYIFNSYTNPAGWIGQVMQAYLGEITKQSGGKINFEMYWLKSLGFETSEFLRVSRDDLAQFGASIVAYHADVMPHMAVATIPMLCPEIEEFNKVRPMLEPMLREILDRDWNTLLLFNSPITTNTLWTSSPVKSIEDLRGLKVRTSTDTEAEWCNNIGLVPVKMPGSEAYTALQRGTIDGYIGGSGSVLSFKMYEVVKYRPLSAVRNMWQILYVNKDVWQGMPDEFRKAINDATESFAQRYYQDIYSDHEKDKDELQRLGVDFTTLSDEEVAKLVKEAEPVWESWAKRYGPEAEEVLRLTREALGK